MKHPKSTYPLPGFPTIGPGSMEDWVPIDGTWHSIVYVSHGPLPDLYVDGKLVAIRGPFAYFDRALSDDEIAEHYRVGTAPKQSYADAVRATNPVYYSGDDPAFADPEPRAR